MTLMIIDVTHCDSVIRLSSIVPTLQARMGTGGGQVPIVFARLDEQMNKPNTKENVLCLSENGTDRSIEEELAPSVKTTTKHVITDGFMAVRRLTPVECERLQGMPDDWTRIPYRGKPAEECPDSPRYKAIGNSWAVPVIQWIGRRIDAAVKEQKND
jgi:DNA (cytosine-5)-methyltransferase 1